MPLITGSMQKQLLVGPASMVVRRNGWLYVYVSNESNQNVFFDNLVINHTRGPVVEKKEFYPFGMEIPGLSTQAFTQKYSQNRGKKDLMALNMISAFGLNEYKAFYRDYDPEIGRWWQIDPKPDYSQSLYSAMNNNPISINDPLGDNTSTGFRTGFLGIFGKKANLTYDEKNQRWNNKDGSAYTGKTNKDFSNIWF